MKSCVTKKRESASSFIKDFEEFLKSQSLKVLRFFMIFTPMPVLANKTEEVFFARPFPLVRQCGVMKPRI